MLKKSELLQILNEQQSTLKIPEDQVEREIFKELSGSLSADNRILVITGLRRTGKSTLLKQLINNCKTFYYISFEDERFLNFEARDFTLLNEVFIEFYGLSDIYFFDEIQNIRQFEAFIRKLQDNGKKVVITGSNSDLPSDELGSKLTGRYKSFDILPFSFNEFLRFKHPEIQPFNTNDLISRVTYIKAFADYFNLGGMPEYLKYKDDQYIRTLFENIIYKDIIARYNIRKQKIFRELMHLLVSNLTLPFTYNSLKNNLGLSNADTVREYIFYLSNTYLLYELKRFDYSVKKQLNGAKKIFLSDHVFNRLLGFNFSENSGRRLENLVHLELRRRYTEMWYVSEKPECDFVVKNGSSWEVFQVCYELNPGNRDREITGLINAMKKFDLKKGFLLTYDEEDQLETDSLTIFVEPVWKWLLAKTSSPEA